MITKLVINGCSYSKVYSGGMGPFRLAYDLGLPSMQSIALGGSNNSRILRTTLKHSYQSNTKNLYVVGLSFINRWELPIKVAKSNDLEGRWINPQSSNPDSDVMHPWWTEQDTEHYKNLSFKAASFGIEDLIEDLMYRCVTTASDLHNRGHRIVFYNHCDDMITESITAGPQFDLLRQRKYFVDALTWVAVMWQLRQGAKPYQYPGLTGKPPPLRFNHIDPDHYQWHNEYLTKWISENKILQ